MKKKYLFINLAILFIFSCTTIASLMDEPTPPIKHTIKDLSTYEAKLTDYIMYLQVFLTRTRKKFINDTNYPKFTYFDSSTLKHDHTIDSLLFNIKLLKDYISITKPIAQSVYMRYSKLKN
ncbi:BBA14 family lipoprotein [Borrelia miyamotoi]|uniref:Outer surface protein n=1 Tax=Borrelia miyamotoi TaxID=47466 RepID=A0AAQ3AHQ0_9SPIR|nr:BBA14 family lipoprotein [Borrelia miyamotoi]WAZ91717.1 hypothetical protein O5398_06075 [Borrelia miyamotoi]WAZ94301.1 hypothetical protein O5399_06115 [Borrelia miyamotoi]WAZ95568.1 hypothetical protein O5397_05970 [Borrelia miyamotoi]WAZ96873.1 hypothetical protein O5405_06095 [Borrelia miyamotoi]WAZ98188.1 hypothetical protein O5401_06050 [Borrelia miyamotoi]